MALGNRLFLYLSVLERILRYRRPEGRSWKIFCAGCEGSFILFDLFLSLNLYSSSKEGSCIISIILLAVLTTLLNLYSSSAVIQLNKDGKSSITHL